MKYLLIIAVVFALWIAFEIWRAPVVDENDNTIRPTKKIKDLFK
jgi:hypothetical protein